MSRKLVSLLLVACLLVGMSPALAQTISVTDQTGRTIAIDGPVTRIVALSPSDCEIICALGCQDILVGRGEYCDFPASVTSVPAVATGAGTNVEQILALAPQVLVMTSMAQTPEQVQALEDNGVHVLVSENTDIEGAYDAITVLGTVLGKETQAEELISDMRSAFAEIRQAVASADGEKKTVYFEVSPLEWGLYTAGAGTFMDEIAEICGLENVFSDVQGWAAVSQEQVIERDPDLIVSVSGMPDADVEIASREGWTELKAVRNGALLVADANAFSRPGPRLRDAAQALYAFVYEEKGDATSE